MARSASIVAAGDATELSLPGHRSTHDSRKTLETFGVTVHQEMDLVALTGQFVTVVNETMRSTHVSLWLSTCPQERHS